MKIQKGVAGNEHEILCAGLPYLLGCTFSQKLETCFFILTAQGAELPAEIQHQAAALSHQHSQAAVFQNTIAAPPPFLR